MCVCVCVIIIIIIIIIIMCKLSVTIPTNPSKFNQDKQGKDHFVTFLHWRSRLNTIIIRYGLFFSRTFANAAVHSFLNAGRGAPYDVSQLRLELHDTNPR